MKREDLKNVGLTDEQVQAIMDLHKVDAESWKAEKQGFIKAQQELNDKLKGFDSVDVEDMKKKLSEWQKKYDSDMLKKDKDFAMAELFRGQKFSSKYAEKAIKEEFEARNLEFKDGQFLGADDFFESLKKSDPEAFEKSSGDPEIEHKDSSGLNLKPKGELKSLSGVEEMFYQLNPDLKKG